MQNQAGTEKDKGTSRCRSCGAEIRFIRTATFKTVPVNAEPIWIRLMSGGYTYIQENGNAVIGIPAGDADDDPKAIMALAYESHFATCPDAGKYRKGKKERKARTRAPGYR